MLTLVVENIGKNYGGGRWGVREFSLTLQPGITGLLGPNGAGKSTLMRMLATITRLSAGRVLWNGLDLARKPDAVRRVLGYLPQDFGVYPNLSALEFLEYLAAVKGLEARAARRRIDELLQLLNLTEAAKRPLGGYSGGMRQRVGIAQALLNDPQLLIVDEPTVGLDPEERVRFRQLLADLAGERIVLLSTHIVSDVEATAARIALMNGGWLLAHATPDELLRTVENAVWEWRASEAELAQARSSLLIAGALRQGEGVRVRALSVERPHPQAVPAAPTLEDAYLFATRAAAGL